MTQFQQQTSARSETLGADSATSRGVTLTAGGSGSSYGSWTTVGTTGFDYEMFFVDLGRQSIAQDYIVDIGIDLGGGSAFVIAERLRMQGRSGGAVDNVAVSYPLPLHVPAGATLVARVACSSASGTIAIVIRGFSNGINGVPGFSRCVPLYTASSSRGPAVDAGGVAHTMGSETEMVASTSVPVEAVMGFIGPNADVSRASSNAVALLDIGVGSAGSVDWYFKSFQVIWSTAADTPVPTLIPPFPWHIPAGSRIAARMQSIITVAGDRTLDLALWGFVH